MATPRMQRPADFLAFLRVHRWFAELDEPFQQALLSLALLHRLKRGEALFRQGDAPNGLWAVVEGSVKMVSRDAQGEELLLTVFEPPSLIGEMALFDGLPRSHDAAAEQATVALQFPQAALERLLAQEPQRWRDLGRLLASRLRLTLTAMEDQAGSPLLIRVARRIAYLAAGHGDWVGRTPQVLELPQGQLAAMLGITRQTANELLGELETRGLVKPTYGGIALLDLPGLRRLGDGG